MSFRLLDLPAEVIQNVCRQAEKNQLKPLSLTCQRVHTLASPVLFHSLALGQLSGECTGSLIRDSLCHLGPTTWTYVRHLRMQVSPFDRTRAYGEDQGADTDWENEEEDPHGVRRFKHAVSIERARRATCVWRNCLALMTCLSSLTITVNVNGLESMEDPTSVQQWRLFTDAITGRCRSETHPISISLAFTSNEWREWTGSCWPRLFSPFAWAMPNIEMRESPHQSWGGHASLSEVVPSHIGGLAINDACIADLKELGPQVCLTTLELSYISSDNVKEAFQLMNRFSNTLKYLAFRSMHKQAALDGLGILQLPRLRRLKFSSLIPLEEVVSMVSAIQLKAGCSMEIAQLCLTQNFGQPAFKRFCTVVSNKQASPFIDITWLYAPRDDLATLRILKHLNDIVMQKEGVLRLHLEFESRSTTDHGFSGITEMLATIHQNDLDMCLWSLKVVVADITLPSSPLDRNVQDATLVHLWNLRDLTLQLRVEAKGWVTFGLNRMLNTVRMPRLATLAIDFHNTHCGQQLSVLEANLPYFPSLANVFGSILVAQGGQAPAALQTFQQKCREIGTRGEIRTRVRARLPILSPVV